jgi:hypothetical protein
VVESRGAWAPGLDCYCSSRRLDELEKCLSKAERVTLRGTTRALPLESPAALNEAVLRFLGKQ